MEFFVLVPDVVKVAALVEIYEEAESLEDVFDGRGFCEPFRVFLGDGAYNFMEIFLMNEEICLPGIDVIAHRLLLSGNQCSSKHTDCPFFKSQHEPPDMTQVPQYFLHGMASAGMTLCESPLRRT